MTVNGSVEWQCRPPAAATATGCVPTAKLVSAQPASAAAASRVPLVVMGTPWTVESFRRRLVYFTENHE